MAEQLTPDRWRVHKGVCDCGNPDAGWIVRRPSGYAVACSHSWRRAMQIAALKIREVDRG